MPSSSSDNVGGNTVQWLMFGSFTEGPNGRGTIPDFDFAEAKPCRCASPYYGGPSLVECHSWTATFLERISLVGPPPSTRILHWKGKHVVFIGPLSPVAVLAAIETVESLGLQSKSQLLTTPDNSSADDTEQTQTISSTQLRC